MVSSSLPFPSLPFSFFYGLVLFEDVSIDSFFISFLFLHVQLVVGKETAMTPLVMVITATALKDIYEDYYRF